MSLTATTTTDTTSTTSTLSATTDTSRLQSSLSPTSEHSTAHPPSQSSHLKIPPPRTLRKRLPTSTRSGSGIASRSTPNLGSLFQSHGRPSSAIAAPPVPPIPSLPFPSPPLPPGFPPALLLHKGSLAALTQSSLASIPDATESYALDTLTEFTTQNHSSDADPDTMAPLTPGRFASSMASYSGAPSAFDEVAVGDEVDVPGGMVGTVRFVGSVNGRKGTFAGVELHPEFATRGKNSGDVDGVSYFNTTLHGAGIFLPLAKAVRRDVSLSSFPMTPSALGSTNGLKLGNQNSTNYTPPTPSIPKFSQSVSGGGPPRAPSPQRRPPRTSLSRPDSPQRRVQMTPGPTSRPSLATPGVKASISIATGGASAGGGKYGSPTSASKFSQSMRAPSTSNYGDPAKKGMTGLGLLRNGAPGAGTSNLMPDRSLKASIGPRSVSALGGPAGPRYSEDEPPMPPLGRIPGMRTMPSRSPTSGSGNGSVGSASSFGRGVGSQRPMSRTAGHKKNGSIATTTTLANNDEEVERLRTKLDDRERQLKDQANTLADMESSLTELQTLIGSGDGPLGMSMKGGSAAGGTNFGDELDEVSDLSQMRALLREKNEKIAMLTAEFDAHRADFRSTIDTLEMASTETERVYEKKIEEMIQEVQELESRLADVDVVAQQLKQLEELVQELEEGLEDARRGEAEARGEVEFLRGEVERTRTELRRERERLGNGPAKQSNAPPAGLATAANGDGPSYKDLEQKDDEIRGLKAIIHSLSQNAGVQDLPSPGTSMSKGSHRRGESINERLAREALEREVADLRALLATKSTRESEMQQEIETLRVSGSNSKGNSNGNGNGNRASAITVGSRSSLRDSRGTVVLARDFREAISSSLNGHNGHNGTAATGPTPNRAPHHSRGSTLETMPESDAYSSVTESSTLWCEICETNGHDILTCTNMFGAHAGKPLQPHTMKSLPPAPLQTRQDTDRTERSGQDIVRAALATTATSTTTSATVTSKTVDAPVDIKILPNPMESGPVAGKESGVVDAGKWCALCERDGHDSVDCPFEDAF